ncbi:MAG: DegQ family serine endoprotease [Alphaproteobacteria bacterium]|nr:DegQ family serine endoprotease [Alphaproteobacteria bacterium]
MKEIYIRGNAMKKLRPVFGLLLCLITIPALITPGHAALPGQNAPESFADIVDKLLPAVVNISSTQKMIQPEMVPPPQMAPDQEMPQFPEGSPFQDFFEEFMQRRGPGVPMEPEASLGSGFVIDAENGYIITNNHVVKDADEIRVTFQDDETIPAKLIGTDEKTDIAVLKIDTKKKLTAVPFGDSDKLRVGDWIVAIGNPFGLGGTVTAGIVSARARDINAGPYDDFIQTDASINRGNSGGPMFDLEGEVIGINTAIFSPSGGSVGIGFAIPSSLAKPVVDQIIQYGRTRRGWLGVRIQKVTEEIAESLGLSKAKGALVASVTQDGPSENSGLRPGDVIMAFNGHEINDMRELPRLVAETPINSEATVTYWRGGKVLTTKVPIGELEKAEEDGLLASNDMPEEENRITGTKIKPLGLSIKPLDPATRAHYGIDSDTKGLVITDMEATSEAAQKGLYEGDVIIEINQQQVQTPEDALGIIKKAQESGRPSVLLLVNHEDDSRFMALKIEKQTEKDDNKEKKQ